MTVSTFHSTRLPVVARLANRVGDALAAAGSAPISLDEGDLLDAAARRAGLSDWGGDEFREPLGVFLRSAEQDADLTLLGRLWIRELCLGNLVTRLQIAETLQRHPEIREVPLPRPLFIMGLPRTGSTLLHNLLAQDPAVRAPLAWEMNSPCPPPRPERPSSDRARLTQLCAMLWVLYYLAPGLRVGHFMHPSRPDECLFLFMKSFMDFHFTQSFGAFGYYDWFVKQDLTKAYEYYRTELQILCRHFPGERLVLKYPYHAFNLGLLIRLFPDALIVQTHRDPCKVIPSSATLAALTQRSLQKRVDLPRLGRTVLDFNARSVLNALEARKHVPGGQYVDVHYRDLLRDPIAAVEGIYRAFDHELSSQTRQRMTAYLADNPQHKLGIYRYSVADFDLDAESIRRAMGPYCEAHGIEPEP